MRQVLAVLILIICAFGLVQYSSPVYLSPTADVIPEGQVHQSDAAAGEASEDGESDLGLFILSVLALPHTGLFLSARSRLFCRLGCPPLLPHPPQTQLVA
jgi:hypothetical protein